MGTSPLCRVLLFLNILLTFSKQFSATKVEADQTVSLVVNASKESSRKIPETMFGAFFEEINHAGSGGLWGELVNNRGFEAGGQNTPSYIDPWSVIGDESSLIVSTERSSCFERNKIALRMEVLCDDHTGPNICPAGGIGIYNPGFWGMNIEQGKTYKLVLYIRSSGPIDISVSLTGAQKTLASESLVADGLSNWTKKEILLKAQGSDTKARLQLTTTKKGVIWLDQVSLMPTDTYKGHGFRIDLFEMLKTLKPAFIRFPGGCFVEGIYLRNAFRWKETIGPWEERPGHFGDVWEYWTDDGLGYFELLQLAEDLGAAPVWVFNNGVSHTESVDTSLIAPFVQEIMDGLEFARGDSKSKWGSVRAAMGHPEPFDLKYVGGGNEDCGKKDYLGNYLKFYSAIKRAYPDIKIISNCDASHRPLDHPADLYDYHIYRNAPEIFSMAHAFDRALRNGPKAFVSEYAVNRSDAAKGNLLAALAEAGFLIGLEKNCDVVEMASYAPLFVNVNDRKWDPDSIVFDSSQHYGTPSYWMQHFFKESNGATLLSSSLQSTPSNTLIASAIVCKDSESHNDYLRIKVVNFGSSKVALHISIAGVVMNSLQVAGSSKLELTSSNLMDENTFTAPNKVVPVKSGLDHVGTDMDVVLSPHSLTSLNLLMNSGLNMN